jgi:hypothetical protein
VFFGSLRRRRSRLRTPSFRMNAESRLWVSRCNSKDAIGFAKPGMPAEEFTPSHRGKTVSKLFALEVLELGLSEFPELRNH